MVLVGRAAAFAPGHVTGFFQICDQPSNPLAKGSRGAGLCTTLGARSAVAAERAKSASVSVTVNGRKSDAPVTAAAVRFLMDSTGASALTPLKVRVSCRHDLPVSQGFGMSGAGALSASIGLAYLLCDRLGYNVSLDDAVAAAHIAEISCRTGLGDVAGQALGGIEMRLKPGLAPLGIVSNIRPGEAPAVVLCVIGGKMPTKKVLADPAARKRISAAGRKCMELLVRDACLETVFMLSNRFSREAGLETPEISAAVSAAKKAGFMAAQSMLGNSVFACAPGNKAKRLRKILSAHGKTFACAIDEAGATMLARR